MPGVGCQELTGTQTSESVTSMFSLTNLMTEIHKQQKDELEMSFMTHSETGAYQNEGRAPV